MTDMKSEKGKDNLELTDLASTALPVTQEPEAPEEEKKLKIPTVASNRLQTSTRSHASGQDHNDLAHQVQDMLTQTPMSIGSGLMAAQDAFLQDTGQTDRNLANLYSPLASAVLKTLSTSVGNLDKLDVGKRKLGIVAEAADGKSFKLTKAKSSLQMVIGAVSAACDLDFRMPLEELDRAFADSPHARRWNKLLTGLSGAIHLASKTPGLLMGPFTAIDTSMFYIAFFVFKGEKLNKDTSFANTVNFILEKICKDNKNAARALGLCLVLLYFSATWPAKQMMEADINAARNFGRMLGSILEMGVVGRGSAFTLKKGIDALASLSVLLLPMLVGTDYSSPRIEKTGPALKAWVKDLPTSLDPTQWKLGNYLEWFKSTKDWSYLSKLIQEPTRYASGLPLQGRYATYVFDGVMAWITQIAGYTMEQVQKKGIQPTFNDWKKHIQSTTQELQSILVDKAPTAKQELLPDMKSIMRALQTLRFSTNSRSDKANLNEILADVARIKNSFAGLLSNSDLPNFSRQRIDRLFKIFSYDYSSLPPENQLLQIGKLVENAISQVTSIMEAPGKLGENINDMYNVIAKWDGAKSGGSQTKSDAVENFRADVSKYISKSREMGIFAHTDALEKLSKILVQDFNGEEEAGKIIDSVKGAVKEIKNQKNRNEQEREKQIVMDLQKDPLPIKTGELDGKPSATPLGSLKGDDIPGYYFTPEEQAQLVSMGADLSKLTEDSAAQYRKELDENKSLNGLGSSSSSSSSYVSSSSSSSSSASGSTTTENVEYTREQIRDNDKEIKARRNERERQQFIENLENIDDYDTRAEMLINAMNSLGANTSRLLSKHEVNNDPAKSLGSNPEENYYNYLVAQYETVHKDLDNFKAAVIERDEDEERREELFSFMGQNRQVTPTASSFSSFFNKNKGQEPKPRTENDQNIDLESQVLLEKSTPTPPN